MSDFTPGKWEVDVLYGDHFMVFANDHVVADCFGSEANAQLIAAAPEMYEFLREYVTSPYANAHRASKQKALYILACIDGEEVINDEQ